MRCIYCPFCETKFISKEIGWDVESPKFISNYPYDEYEVARAKVNNKEPGHNASALII